MWPVVRDYCVLYCLNLSGIQAPVNHCFADRPRSVPVSSAEAQTLEERAFRAIYRGADLMVGLSLPGIHTDR